MAKTNSIIPKATIKNIEDADKAINQLDDSTLNFEKSIDKLLKTLSKEKISFDDLTKTQKKAKTETKNLSDEEKKLEQIEKNIKNTTDEVVKARIKAAQKTKEQKERIQELVDSENKELGTEEKLLIANKNLRNERKKLNTETEEGKKRQSEINEQLDKNNDLIKENSDKFKANRMSVGGYEEGIRSAMEGNEAFSGSSKDILGNLTSISESEGGVKGFFQTYVAGMKSAIKAGLKFILTPIGAVIFAIVAAIGLFTAAIKRNEGASDKFSKIWAGITNVISEVTSRIFKLASAAAKLITGDFKGAMQAGKEAVTGFGKAMTNAYTEGAKLLQMQIDLAEATISSTTEQARLNAEIERLDVITGDSTKSFKEREEAAAAARVAQIALSEETIRLAQMEADEINLRVEQAERQGTINRELRQEQADGLAKVIEAEGAVTLALATNEKERDELKQDRLEKDLDILIDGFDNIKGINERIISDDKRTVEERAKLLEDTRKLSDDSYAKQIETIKQFTSVQFDEADLLNEQDAIALNEKIRRLGLSEIIEGRLLEVIRDRRTAVQDLNDAEQGLNDETFEKAKTLLAAQTEAVIREKQRELDAKILFARQTSETEEEFAEKSFEINQNFLKEQVLDLKKVLSSSEVSAENRLKLEQDLADALLEIDNNATDRKLTNKEKLAEKDAELAEKQMQTQEALFEIGTALGNALFEFGSIKRDKEIADIEAKNKAGLLSDEAAAKKIADIKTKQAKADKKQSLFNIAISTAEAILRVTAQTGVLSPLIIPSIIALGLIEAAVVASQKIPEFYKGTKSAPDGLISVAEKGMELAHKKTGELMLFNKPTITDDMGGARIYTNEETKQILGSGHSPSSQRELDNLIKSVENSGRNTVKAISNIRIPIVDETGKNIGFQRGTFKRKYI